MLLNTSRSNHNSAPPTRQILYPHALPNNMWSAEIVAIVMARGLEAVKLALVVSISKKKPRCFPPHIN